MSTAIVSERKSQRRSRLTLASMERLPFTLPDFTRVSWVSDLARENWQPRLQRIMAAWMELEWLTIVSGVRSCCITMVSPEQFLELGPRWAQLGLNALPIEIQGIGRSYSSTQVKTELGKPYLFRFVLGSPQHVSQFKEVRDRGDECGIGTLLGYPACCQDFFKRVWVDQGLVDTTWPMAVGSAEIGEGSRTVEVSSPRQANILWRWMGVRTVPHLPCSFCCDATVELADRFIEVGRKHGFQAEMDWLLEILDWPVEWSALHGIAEIKTPILKVSTRTDATPCKYLVRYKGKSYPTEGARGLNFPFRVPSLPLLTESLSFKKGLDNPIEEHASWPAWFASDNGFASVAAMNSSHEPIIQAASVFLGGRAGPVLDVGCGNGALLKKLLESNPAVIPFGIDCDGCKIAHAGTLLPTFKENFVFGDAFQSRAIWPGDRRYLMALLMPGRLLEVGPDRASQLRARLRDQCDRVFVYAYGDWRSRCGNLKGLAAEAGLELLSPDENAAVGLARVL